MFECLQLLAGVVNFTQMFDYIEYTNIQNLVLSTNSWLNLWLFVGFELKECLINFTNNSKC